MKVSINIKGIQEHITAENDTQNFGDESKALQHLRLKLDKIGFNPDMSSHQEPVIIDGAYFDTGDYIVHIEVSDN
jgi:hypothetical protein